ncbi:MAG: ABC transporter ATP-binding protein [Methanomassiliicoccales archaeon]|nr:ABC transporter ATP-binding protein [Methanomassiliicoccales archaeon]NYT15617.1 ABC transporter ATP-binding protein [Methanomassiliicoccales archaeon]
MEKIVQIQGVTKEYQSGDKMIKAVNDLSLDIGKGKFVVILGPSGSGKTTLLNIISGLISPTEGNVMVGDKQITSLNDDEATRFRAESIGFVFQFFNLFPTLNALENIEIGLALKIKDPKELRERSLRYLDMVGLKGMEAKFPDQLSGGEQQRVSVARALAMEPELLIADEPTGNLDAETGETIWELIRDLNRETGTTVLAVTHWDEASQFADVTIRIRSGRIESIKDREGTAA